MSPRNELIQSIRKAIIELKKRRQNPNTLPPERAKLTAKIAQLEGRLAVLLGQSGAEDADAAALAGPDDATFADMRSAARDLDDAVAAKKATSTIVALVNDGFAALQQAS